MSLKDEPSSEPLHISAFPPLLPCTLGKLTFGEKLTFDEKLNFDERHIGYGVRPTPYTLHQARVEGGGWLATTCTRERVLC